MSTRMEMDDETAALITQLQLQDSTEELERSQAKGKNVEGTLSDHQLALQLIQEDLKRHATILNDRKMAASMRQAVQADAELLETSITQEQAELNDRREACRLGGVAPPPLAIEAAPADNDIDDRLLGIMVSASHSVTNGSHVIGSPSRIPAPGQDYKTIHSAKSDE